MYNVIFAPQRSPILKLFQHTSKQGTTLKVSFNYYPRPWVALWTDNAVIVPRRSSPRPSDLSCLRNWDLFPELKKMVLKQHQQNHIGKSSYLSTLLSTTMPSSKSWLKKQILVWITCDICSYPTGAFPLSSISTSSLNILHQKLEKRSDPQYLL